MSVPSPDPHPALLLERLGLPGPVSRAVKGRLRDPGATAQHLPDGWAMAADGWGGWRLLGTGKSGRRLPWAAGDRFGHLHLAGRWDAAANRLAEAWFRLPAGGWLELSPGTGTFPLWGTSDTLIHHPAAPQPGAGRPVGVLAAVDWAAPAAIPPFDRPGALPPGAGSAVMNFLALMLALNGVATAGGGVAYRGPYPTAALFDTLCRSFAPDGPAEATRALFTRDETALAFRARMAESPVRWRPAPFAVLAPAEALTLHVRDGIETAWVRGVPFRKASGGAMAGGALASGERVWPEEDGWAVGLALLGRPYCRFYRLDASGAVRQAAPLDADDSGPPVDAATLDGPVLHEHWRPAVCAWATLRAHAGLAAALAEAEPDLELRWADLPLRLAMLEDDGDGRSRLRVQRALAAAYRARVETEDAAALAMMLVSDLLEACTPFLLRWAQGRLERRLQEHAAPPASALLAAGEAAQQAARGTLERALPALVQALVRGEALP